MNLSGIDIVPFTAVAAILAISPGPDLLLVINSALHRRAAAGILAALGVSLGVLLWSCLAGLGLIATLLSNELVFSILTLLGAVCLLAIGLVDIRNAVTGAGSPAKAPAGRPVSGMSCFVKGVLVNISNPKVGVFYIVVLPQFVAKEHLGLGSALVLGGIHIALGLVWYTLCAVFVDAAQARLTSRRFVRWMRISAGTMFLVLALIVIIQYMVSNS